MSSGPKCRPEDALTSARSPTTRPPARSGTIIAERKPSARRTARCSSSCAAASSIASGISASSSGSPERITCGEPTAESGSSGQRRSYPRTRSSSVGSSASIATRSIAAVVAQQLDEAPVGEPRHGELREQPERRLEVERAGEQRARVRERVGAPARRLELGDVLERQHGDRRPAGRHDRVAGRDQRARPGRRLPVDAHLGEPLAGGDADVLRRLHVHREGAAGRLVGGPVGEHDPPAAGRDQQQRRRQHVEQRLVPAAVRDLNSPLEPFDYESVFRLPGESLMPAPRPRTRAGSPRRAAGGPPRRAGSR